MMYWPAFYLTLIAQIGLLQARAEELRQRLAGADVSMLLEIEKAGGVFHDRAGARDAIEILRDHGCNLFRLRLFVDPDPDHRNNYGATQNLNVVRTLARRIKSTGADWMLDIHYSDTWADPKHQHKPRAWEKFSFDELERTVYDYTAGVLAELNREDLAPAIVQVGNEIAGGMLWPDGNVLDVPSDQQDLQWRKFTRLLQSGCRAVRDASDPRHPTRIAIHIHGGGRANLPAWFFRRLRQRTIDYDIIALSFYPQWGDSLEELTKNLNELASDVGKDVLLAEVSYPWKEIDGIKDRTLMKWPLSRDGQVDFLKALNGLSRSNSRLLGYVWWYPEAIPLPQSGFYVWKSGGEALFDDSGAPLPAMRMLGNLTGKSKLP